MTPEIVTAAIAQSLEPGRFFVGHGGRIEVVHQSSEQVAWEVFRGHLLEPAHTRETLTGPAWHVFVHRDGETAFAPLISLRFDPQAGVVHVTRQILTRGFQAVEDSPGVIVTRAVQKWLSELVETIVPEGLGSETLADAVGRAVYLSVIGTSRLPITSLESPLPGFALGHIGYLPHSLDRDSAWQEPVQFLEAALTHVRDVRLSSRALEVVLRAASQDDPRAIANLLHAHQVHSDGTLLHELFNNASLSPYTTYVDRLLATLSELAEPARWSPLAVIDLLGYMLRHLCRHLTAFDLKTFHSFGANYPDALFLDALLKAYLELLAQTASSFTGPDKPARLRRRALRQGCLLRRHYEGHAVPDAPTTPGENARVLPAALGRVPEEQITQPQRRRKALFSHEPTEGLLSPQAQEILQRSITDLRHDAELRELGLGYFLERPLGTWKPAGEPDRTPLVSCEAWSLSIAKQRLAALHTLGWLDEAEQSRLDQQADRLAATGVPVASLSGEPRPGVVSLRDALRASPDFRLLRTTPRSLRELLNHYDLSPLETAFPEVAAWLREATSVLLIPRAATHSCPAAIEAYDPLGQLRCEFLPVAGAQLSALYVGRQGSELPRQLRMVDATITTEHFAASHRQDPRTIRLDLK